MCLLRNQHHELVVGLLQFFDTVLSATRGVAIKKCSSLKKKNWRSFPALRTKTPLKKTSKIKKD